MVTLYIGGLAPQVNEPRLHDMFSCYGEICETRLIANEQGECRGFAYVTFSSDLSAAKARVALNGKEIDGRILRVALAT